MSSSTKRPAGGVSRGIRQPIPWFRIGAGRRFAFPSGVPDPGLLERVKREVGRSNRYQLASALGEADLVLLLHTTWRAELRARTPGDIWYHNPTVPDEHVNRLDSAVALALPTSAYLAALGNIAALVVDAAWGATSGPQEDPLRLVRRFLRANVPRQPSGICATYQRPLVTAPPPHAPSGSFTVPLRHAPDSVDAPARPDTKPDAVVVAVPVLVTDANGADLGNLSADDFQIVEDEADQRIAGIVPDGESTNVALLLDTSSSMRSGLGAAKAAASAYVDILASGDRVMVASVDSRIRLVSDFTSDHGAIQSTLPLLRSGGDASRVFDGIAVTLDRLDREPGRKVLVVVTDGADVGSGFAGRDDLLRRFESNNVVLYVLQLDTFRDLSGLGPLPGRWDVEIAPLHYFDKAEVFRAGGRDLEILARTSGGGFRSASPGNDASRRLAELASLMRRQYVLYYHPARQSGDGSYRRIHVSVNRPGATLQHRPGYRLRPGDP